MRVPSWLERIDRWLDDGEPHAARGPFARWPRATDTALAAAVLLGSVITVAVSGLDDGDSLSMDTLRDLSAGAVVLLALAAATLGWRRARAREVAMAIMTITLLWALLSFGDGHDLASIVAAYSAGRYLTEPRRSALIMVGLGAVNIAGTLIDSTQRVDIAPAIVLAFVPWYVGRRVRNRGAYVTLLRERSERLEAERHATIRQAEADERARIARELHDVVAHQVSMMTVQAGAAKTIARDDLDVAIEAMRDVEHAGRATLGELRHLLGVLRADPDEKSDLDPQPDLSAVPGLVDELRSTGAVVDFAQDRNDPGLSAATELAAFRLIQESITNIVKHAGPRPQVSIAVSNDENELRVQVENTMHAATNPLPSIGLGLTGMRERVSLLGGQLTAGPAGPGRFRVDARLPIGERR